ncbi:hypothetical protein Thermo_00624 [Thermoplasmatales archaeon]|nr:hypothetical protein Thermo_00624 [Thermoplasmatales archaeon]
MKAFEKFVMHSVSNYGIYSNKLDQLQYVADLNFAYLYKGNFSRILSSYRVITPVLSSLCGRTREFTAEVMFRRQ